MKDGIPTSLLRNNVKLIRKTRMKNPNTVLNEIKRYLSSWTTIAIKVKKKCHRH